MYRHNSMQGLDIDNNMQHLPTSATVAKINVSYEYNLKEYIYTI